MHRSRGSQLAAPALIHLRSWPESEAGRSKRIQSPSPRRAFNTRIAGQLFPAQKSKSTRANIGRQYKCPKSRQLELTTQSAGIGTKQLGITRHSVLSIAATQPFLQQTFEG